MTPETQALAIGVILMCGLVAFATGRIRHDLVAILMLLASVGFGLVAPDQAFTGFGDPVVITVAAVMVLSGAVARSNVLRLALNPLRSVLGGEIGIAAVFSLLTAVASAFMNNIGALALLMPAALAACRAAMVSPSRVLMPMAFASLLGGLITVIGTPPNVIIARLRAEYTGEAFAMFDFAPVGGAVALAGLVVMLLGLKLLPKRIPPGNESSLFRISDYLFEVRVLERNRDEPLTVRLLEAPDKAGSHLVVHAIDRRGIISAAPTQDWKLYPGDVVQLEGRAPEVQVALDRHGLELVGGTEDDALEAALFECVVPETSRLVFAPDPRQELSQANAALLAVSRRGRSIIERLDKLELQSGDVVLLQAPESMKRDIVERFSLLPLAERGLDLSSAKGDWRPALGLAGAILAASLGASPLALALIAAAALLALLGLVTEKAYRDVDWSIILLLAAMIPVAQAFSDLGGGAVIAQWLSGIADGQTPLMVIGLVLGATMAATPFLNNAAAVLIMAPIGVSVGQATGVSPDAMLMAVCVGASCDFLTPVGHQSNTLVMGPGGYRFFDYPKLGLLVSITVLVVGTWAIERFWA